MIEFDDTKLFSSCNLSFFWSSSSDFDLFCDLQRLFLSLEDSRFLFTSDTQQSVSVVFSDILYEG